MIRYITTVLSLVLTLFGCTDDSDYGSDVETGEIVTLINGIVIHRTDVDALYYLDGALKTPSFEKLFVPAAAERIVWFQAGPDPAEPDTLFVMTEPEDARAAGVDERLYRVKTNGSTTAFEVGSPFDEIAFGPNQRFAILYHGETDLTAGLYNPNEVSLIDLTAKPGKNNPRTLSVSMDGRKIDQVAFVPSISVGGVERELAVFLAGSIARVVDLNDPEGTWAKVPLLPSSDTRTIVPEQLIAVDETPGCDNAACEAKLFIRALGSEDIYYITLGRSGEGFVDPQTKQLEAGGAATDMEIVTADDTTYLVALSYATQGTKVNFVNVDTSESFNIIVTDRVTLMQRLEGDSGEKLVLYGQSGNQGIHFLSLTDIVKEKGRNLTTFSVQGTVSVTVPLDGDRLLLIPGNYQDLIILDLVTEKGAMLSSSGDYDWTDAEIFDDVFFVLPQSNARIDYFDLATGSPDSLLLDDRPVSLHLLTGRQTGVAVHDTPSGRVTIFPLGEPTRNKAKVLDGLWLEGSLNRKGV